ncbi:MAG TPA: hypothetical protein VFU86_07645 [Terriglobales bacterium]|nr:hypothetical protein [Terriglobales bacterium]
MKGRTRRGAERSQKPLGQVEVSGIEDEAEVLKIEKLQEAAAIVVNELPEIMTALVEKAKAGSYLHAKCAFELARIAEIELPKVSTAEPWVEELLSALRALPDPAEPASAS